MIKPIIYHDIREKKKLEAKLFSKIPLEKRKAISREFIDLFFRPRHPDGDPQHIGDNPNTRK
jgi:hypothetical protein